MVDARPVLAAVDAGSTVVRVVFAQSSGGDLEVLGTGSAPSLGIRHGVVVDADRLGSALRQALQQASMAAGIEARQLHVSISGEHIDGVRSQGAVAVEGRGGTISEGDRQRAIDAARTVAIPFDREVLHVLPRDFDVDGQLRIDNPVGMAGVRLGASVHLVTGGITAVRNLATCAERAGGSVAQLVFSPLAAARACLTEDELDMGVGLIDVGGGTTDAICFRGTAVDRTAVIPLGGRQITGDLAVCLRTTWNHAETLKRQFAHGDDETLQVARIAGRAPERVGRADAWEIIEARLEEIFSHLRQAMALDEAGMPPRAGFVLTGGACHLRQTAEVAERVLGAPTRIAAPDARPGLGDVLGQPDWATATGLILRALDGEDAPTATAPRFETVAGRMKSWLEDLL